MAKSKLSLINDILNFAKLEAGQVDFRIEHVAIDSIVAEVDGMLTPRFRQKSIAVERVGARRSCARTPTG